MSAKNWDQELAAIAGEVKNLLGRVGTSEQAPHRVLAAKKAQILHRHLSIQQIFAKIKTFTERKPFLLPREKTLLHFGQIYSEQIEKFYQTKSDLLTRMMWVKLIQTRLTGSHNSDKGAQVIGDEELLDLAARRQNLAKTEKYLSDHLTHLKNLQKELMERYNQYIVAQNNIIAAGSLQARLGKTVGDALQSPTIKALEGYFNYLVSPLHKQQEWENLKTLSQKYHRDTTDILGTAKNIVMKKMVGPDSFSFDRANEKLIALHKKLSEISKLNTETERAHRRMAEATLSSPVKSPNLMQKNKKLDTKDSL